MSNNNFTDRIAILNNFLRLQWNCYSAIGLAKEAIRDLTKNKLPVKIGLVNFTVNEAMLTEKLKTTILDAAKKLTGVKKRAFMAKVTEDYFEGSARKAETYLGWTRETVKKGQKERETGIICLDNYQGRGRKKTEEKLPNLEEDIQSLRVLKSKDNPNFKTNSAYKKVSARQIREALIEEKGYKNEELPGRVTIGAILNRMEYKLKKYTKNETAKKNS